MEEGQQWTTYLDP